MTVEERKKIPQIEDKRAEAIVPGIAMFWRILENFDKNELIVSDWGVKQGALISNFVLKEN
jgi:exopolyphosphatase/guanosine-5'-triphosphate,3'-diphosphate pyrophosphatase